MRDRASGYWVKRRKRKGEKSRGGEAGMSPKAVSMTTVGVHMPHGIGIEFKSRVDITFTSTKNCIQE